MNELVDQREGGGGVGVPELFVPAPAWKAIIVLQSIGGGPPPGPMPIPVIMPGGTPFGVRFGPFFGGAACKPTAPMGCKPGILPGAPIPMGPRCSIGNCPFRCWAALPLPFPFGAFVSAGIINAGVVSGGESMILGSGIPGGSTGFRASFRRVRDFIGNLARQVEQTGVGLQNTVGRVKESSPSGRESRGGSYAHSIGRRSK